jgi:hypothetical protein
MGLKLIGWALEKARPASLNRPEKVGGSFY